MIPYCLLIFVILLYMGGVMEGFTNPIHKGSVELCNLSHDAVVRGNAIVKYYLPGCKYCIMMEKEWEKFARNNKKKNLTVASLNGELHRELTNALGVTSFPTIIFWKNGQPHVVNTPRSEAAWKEFVKTMRV